MSKFLSIAADATEKLTGKKINRERLVSGGVLQLIAKKTIGKQFNPSNHKSETIVLCEEEYQRAEPAVCLPDHMLRITGCNPLTTLESELNMFYNQNLVHGASLLIRFKNAYLTQGSIWSRSRQYLNVRMHQDSILEPVELEAATYVDNEMSAIYFAHWYNDFAPATLTANPERPALSCYVHTYEQLKSHGISHAKAYERLFDLEAIYANRGYIKELFLLQDFGQNSYKIKRYNELRTRLEHKIKPEDCKFKGVYIVRGGSGGKRNLENEPELIEFLSKKGFDILNPEKMTVEEIVKRLWNAPMIIGVDGGAVTHAMYTAAKNAPFLILYPPHRFSYHYKGFCDSMHYPFGMYICQPSKQNDAGSFFLDSLSDMEKLIDLLQEAAQKRYA